MHNFARDINRNLLGNIKYRNNVVTGEVAVDNGNYTYDVYLSGSAVAYPNIPTTMREPDFAVGDAVEILIEYGNKEMPIIIGLAKKIVQEIEVININTLVTTLDAYDITINSAYFEGRIEDIDGYENCLLRGFRYGLTTSYGSDVHEDGSYEAGCYSLQVTGLNNNTNYHFQAYINDADGDEQVGEDKIMKTTEQLIAVIVEQFSDNDYLKFYDLSGNLKNSYLLGNGIVYFETDCMAMDKENNVYYIKNPNKLTKIDSNGTELLSIAIAGYPESIATDPNERIWTREQNNSIKRRLMTDFSITGTFNLTGGKSYYGLICSTETAKIYSINNTDSKIEKRWAAGLLASRSISNTGSDSLGLAGNYIVRTSPSGATIVSKIINTLVADEAVFALTNIDYPHGCGSLSNAYLFVGENNASANLYLEKYNTSDVLEWSIMADDSAGSPDNSLVAAYPF